MPRKINKNLKSLVTAYHNKYPGIVLEGSSRSGKTFSTIDFLIYLALREEFKGTINIIRETYNSFKTTLYDDFKRRLTDFGLPNPFMTRQEVSTFYIAEMKIHFVGADNPSKFHGLSGDIFWFNECLDIQKEIFNQAEMRCRKFFIADYNPKYSKHWFYDQVCNRENICFVKSTFLDNPFISDNEKRKILSYDPDNPVNVTNGTADLYMWKVYGIGERSQPEGVFFFEGKDWFICDVIPKEAKCIGYGLDFGYDPDPTALVKCYIVNNDIYIDELLCETGLTNVTGNSISTRFKELGLVPGKDIIVCDSAEPKSIIELRSENWLTMPAQKGPDSIMFGIKKMKSFRLFVTRRSKNLIDEFRTYVRMKDPLTGEFLDRPDPKIRAKHLCDGSRYIISSQNYYW